MNIDGTDASARTASAGTSTSDVTAETLSEAVLPPATLAEPGRAPATPGGASSQPRLRFGVVTVLVFLTLGASMAVVVPLSYSMAVKLAILAPGRVDVLGYVTAAGAILSIFCTPLVGVLSDRTRGPLGRRRPWVLGGAVLGFAGLWVLATAPSIWVLILAWMVTLVSWQASTNMVISVLGDRLSESQRGRVTAWNGLANNVAPVIGIALVTPFTHSMVPLFLVPGTIAAIGVVLFVIFVRDIPVGDAPATSVKEVFARMVFNPRKVKDFAWNWVGRFALFLGLAFTTTYTSYFFAARLHKSIADIAGILASMGSIGVLAGIVGAIGVGYLSDLVKRRKIFVVIAGGVILAGGIVSALAFSLPGLLVGSVLINLGIGAFSTVDQALVLDVLPTRDESGRYIALMQVAQQIPTALGPVAGAGILAIGAAASPNYTLLYITAGALALVGGLVVMFRVRGVR